jgi:hypothetical protein
VTPEAPAFSLCLFPNQEAQPLAPDNVALGLETDRKRERASRTQFDAFVEVWNPTNYEYISLDEFDDPAGEPEWAFRRLGDFTQLDDAESRLTKRLGLGECG